jgi:hypothetical protein
MDLIVCYISKSEAQRIFRLLGAQRGKREAFGSMTALVLVVLSYVHFPSLVIALGGPDYDFAWVAQNIVNMCIAVTISRVLQIKELKWVVTALVGLALYDYLGVVG